MADIVANDPDPLPGKAESWAPGESIPGLGDTKGVTDKLAGVQREKIAATDKIYGQLESATDRILPRIEQLSKNAGVEAEKMKPWNADEEAAKRKTDPIEAFGSFGSVFGILASAFTHAPMENALNASAAAMHAIKEGDDKSYDRAAKAWESNLKMTMDRHKIQQDAYQDAVSLLSVNMQAANTKLQVLASRFGDKQVLTLLEAGMSKEVQDVLASRQHMALELQQQMPKIVEANAEMSRLFALGYDTKQPTSEQSQQALVKFRQEKAELKRTEHTYGAGGGAAGLTTDRQRAADVLEYRKNLRSQENEDGSPKYTPEQVAEQAAKYERGLKQAATPTSANRTDDLRGKIDQTDNIIRMSEKNLDFLDKFKGGAGLMGKLMRGEEIAENIVGAGTKSDRVQFRRNVLELQEIVPRILTDSNGRPLASAQEKVDGVVAGLAAGDTGPNTKRAYHELIEQMRKRQQDYRGRVEGGYDPSKASSGAGKADPASAPAARDAPWLRDPVIPGGAGKRSDAGGNAQTAEAPLPGARKASDGKWYVSDPDRPGKYLMVQNA